MTDVLIRFYKVQKLHKSILVFLLREIPKYFYELVSNGQNNFRNEITLLNQNLIKKRKNI